MEGGRWRKNKNMLHQHLIDKFVPVCNMFDPSYKLVFSNESIFTLVNLVHYNTGEKVERPLN